MIHLYRFISSHALTREHKFSACLRVVRWQIIGRLVKEYPWPWISGTKLVVRKGMTGATGNIYTGLHEFVDMAFLLHFLRPDDLFVDVGANVGSYTVLASGVCRAQTIAVEPDPDTAARLKRNVDVNKIDERVVIQTVAAGDSNGEVHLTVGLDTLNTVIQSADALGRIVPQKSLDSILLNLAPAMMKIDIEGYEENAILGAQKTLSNPSLRAIQLETVSKKTHEMLANHSFRRVYYDPFHRKLSDSKVNGLESANSLYVRDKEYISARVAAAKKIRILHYAI